MRNSLFSEEAFTSYYVKCNIKLAAMIKYSQTTWSTLFPSLYPSLSFPFLDDVIQLSAHICCIFVVAVFPRVAHTFFCGLLLTFPSWRIFSTAKHGKNFATARERTYAQVFKFALATHTHTHTQPDKLAYIL